MKYFKLKQLTLLLTFEICAVNTLVQILPRDALQARPMLSCGVCVCLSLCVCHVCTFCQNELTYLRNFFTVG